MASPSFVKTMQRGEDFLSLEFAFVNLQLSPDEHLERITPGEPAYVIVRFPPQHIAEEAYFMDANFQGPLDPPPVRTVLANASRLVFRLPKDLDRLPYTMEALLDWEAWEPSLAPNALPRGTQNGPAPAPLQETETAIEFPHRLLLSPDDASRWLHRLTPATDQGRSELWHTRLGVHLTDPFNGLISEDDTNHDVRAIGLIDRQNSFTTSLSQKERLQIHRLSSDFSIRPRPSIFLFAIPLPVRIARYRQALKDYAVPEQYTPLPITAERLTLSALGTSTRLKSAWDFPVLPPEATNFIDLPQFSLEQYQHIAGLGRDQYVRTVKRGFLCDLCHRASLVKVTERIFSPKQVASTPQGAIFGATAYLRQYFTVLVQQPVMDYRSLKGGFAHGGHEMPLRSVRLTTLATPPLDLTFDPVLLEEQVRHDLPHGADEEQFNKALQDAIDEKLDEPFWIQSLGNDFLFQAIGEDVEGNPVSFDLPLMFVPQESLANHKLIYSEFRDGPGSRRTRSLNNQAVVYAPSGDKPGSTKLKTSTLTFDIETEPGTPGAKKFIKPGGLPFTFPVRFLPYMEAAQASIPAVEQLLGTSQAVDVRFDDNYLNNQFDAQANPAQSFLRLVKDLPVGFSAEKSGGLARPDMGVGGLSRSLGAVGKPEQLAARKFDTSIFAGARFLGAITLEQILPKSPIMLNPEDLAPVNLSPADLDNPNFKLKVPALTTRTIYEPGNPVPKAIEARYVWKPELENLNLGILTLRLKQADFLLDARLVRQVGSSDSSFTVDGRLRNFAMDFVDAILVNIQELKFHAEEGKKTEVGASGVDLVFQGPLEFVNTLKNILPSDGFNDPPYVTVDSQGILAGYTLAIPSFGVGIFSLQNIAISAALSVPFLDKPAGVRFALSERHNPFLVTVTLFGGGGFFALGVSAKQLEQVEASIEFGGNISLNLGVASGGVYVMAGIYFNLTSQSVSLTGYLRVGGYLEVLGLISISIEFYLAFTYRHKDNGGSEVWGQASVTVCVEVLCFSTSVKLSVERRFAGAGGDPTFAQTVSQDDWADYVRAFA